MQYVLFLVVVSTAQSFQALGPESSIEYTPPGPTRSVGVVHFNAGWTLLSGGSAGCVSGPIVISSDEADILGQLISNEDVQDQRTLRVTMLGGSGVTVSRLDGTDSHELTEPMTYLEVDLGADGGVLDWRGPEPFVWGETPGTEGLEQEVDDARAETGMP